MARPRKYSTDAERQAAFRARSEIVDRAGLDELRTLLERFQTCARAAARAGDPVAVDVQGATAETTLRRLCERWEAAAVPKPQETANGPETDD